MGVVGEVVLSQDVDDDRALHTLREGVLLSVPGLLGEVGGVAPRDVLERVPLLGDREMAVEQAGGGAGELLYEGTILGRVHCETSHVVSFAVMQVYPAGIEGNLGLLAERQLLELVEDKRLAETPGLGDCRPLRVPRVARRS